MALFESRGVKTFGIWAMGVLLGFAAGNGHTTHNAIADTSDRLGQVQRLAACEDRRADKASDVAKKAIRGALVETAPVPSTHEIPQDCPHPRFMAKH